MAEGRHAAESGHPSAGPGWISAYRVDVAVALLILVSFLVPIVTVGLWDPFELDVAETARRIAVNLLGAEHLTLDGVANSVPIRRELGRGELPFTSVALGFRVLGLSDWAGRLPLVLWASLGVLACYSLVASFADRRTARLSALLLAVTPLYFVHARALSGDATTMAAVAIAVRGLTGALFGSGKDAGLKRRALWLLVGVVGLYAGFWSRGLLIGVALPVLGVSLGWLVVAAPSDTKNWLGWGLLLLGSASAAVGGWELRRVLGGSEYSILLGARIVAVGEAADHDSVLQVLAHGALPLSVLLPFGIARLFDSRLPAPERDRELRLKAVVLGCLIVAFAMHGILAPYAGPLPFAGTFACAIAVALFLRDLDLESARSRLMGLAIVAVAALLLLDFLGRPEKAFGAFVSTSSVFPTTLIPYHQKSWSAVVAALAVVSLFVVADRRPAEAPRFAWRRDYMPYLKALRSAYGGNLWFLLAVTSTGLTIWALLIWASDHYLHISEISNVWSVVRSVAYNAWWAFPLAVFVAPPLVIAAGDVFRSLLLPGFGWFERPLLRRLRFTRTTLCATPLIVGGLFLSLGYYPKLLNQLSPKQVFTRYRELAGEQQPLGLLRLGGSAADYYAEGRGVAMESAREAFSWLNRSDQRRFLMIHAPDLPELNAMFRRERTPPRNLPVLDARSSEILLVSNQLGPGEQSQNPLDAWILDERPAPAHPMKANLGKQLDVLGWEFRDETGRVVRAIQANVPYELAIFYEVTAPLHAEWETFVHIDGYRRRHNGDHETLQGKYPLALLKKGDFVADVHVIKLAPNFTPGTYALYFGLFRGNHRMEVHRGKHVDDRLEAGPIVVR